MYSAIKIFAFTVFITVGVLWYDSGFILERAEGEILRGLIETNFTPRDFDDYILLKEIDASEKGAAVSGVVAHRYMGKYKVAVFFDKSKLVDIKSSNKKDKDDVKISNPFNTTQSVDQRRKLALRVELRFYSGDEVVLTKTLGESYVWMSQLEEMGSGQGLDLWTYRAPDELPNRERLRVEATIVESDDFLNSEYGPLTLAIWKERDFKLNS